MTSAEVLSLLAHGRQRAFRACGGRAEMAAPIVFEREDEFEAVLQPHRDATRQRMAAQSVVIFPSTTEITPRGRNRSESAGPWTAFSARSVASRVVCIYSDGTPLGTVDATAWVREETPINESLSRAQRAAIPIEEKESIRWSPRSSRRAKKPGVARDAVHLRSRQ